MDWILEQTVHKELVGATLGEEVFLDLDYANDIALLAEMLEVLIFSLLVMQEEARPFGLEINWSKTKIQTTVDPHPPSKYGWTVTWWTWWTLSPILEAMLTKMEGAKRRWYDE